MKKTKKKTKKKKIIVTLIILGVLVLIAAGAYFGMAYYYSSRFLSGSKINGIEAGGLTVDQVKQKVRDKIGEYQLTVTEMDEKTETITADDIELEYVDDNKVDELKHGQNYWKWFQSIGSDQSYEMAAGTSYSEEALTTFIEKMDCLQNMTQPVDAALTETDQGFTITPETVGNAIDTDLMKKTIKDAIDAGKTEVSLLDPDCYLKPKVLSTDEALNARCNAWNTFLKTNITYNFGKALDGSDRTVTVNRDVIRPMITDDGTNVSLDGGQVAALVKSWAYEYDTFGLPRPFKTHGGEMITAGVGDYGWAMNQSKTVEALTALIQSGAQGAQEVVYRYSAMSRDENDIGGTYVEVSIDAQMMWCYQDGVCIVETPVVTGLPTSARMTHTGCYAIDAKKSPSVLKGQGYASNVTYWMPFNGNEGIHDADRWRPSYGGSIYQTDGSHGCVNTPIDATEKIYNTVSIGTAVVVY